jgi:16S rRNA (guanine(527)-N(7))-methyltransferase RsmG
VTVDPRRETLLELFQKAGIPLTDKTSDRFWRFFLLFDRYNDEYDLSRIKRFEDIVIKHFIDSALVTTLIDLPSPLLDIGTGPGFPGIPLRLLRDDLEIILAEPRDRRVEFMEKVIGELLLDGVTIYPKRVGDHSDFNVNGVITRAFEAVDGTLARVKHFLPEKGRVIFMKGPAVDEDMDAVSDDNACDYRLISDIEYELPLSGHARRLVVYEKTTAFREHVYTVTDERYARAAISSSDNKYYRDLKKLLDTKGMRKTGSALVSGKKVAKELGSARYDRCDGFIVHDEYRERDGVMHEILTRAHADEKLTIMKKNLYGELDLLGTGGPLAVFRYEHPRVWDGISDGVTLCVPFQDPVNVGSVIRSAAAFGVKSVVLLEGSANPYHPKSVRASAGSVFAIELCEGPSLEDLPALCAANGTPLLALDARGDDIRAFEFPPSCALVPGVEGPGFPDDFNATFVSIPIEREVESLNAAAAATVALFYITRIKK